MHADSHTFEAVWEQIVVAAQQGGHPFRSVVLSSRAAPVDTRIVIVRGTTYDPPSLWFHTDARSNKVLQMRADPQVALLFWDETARLQVRAFGHASCATQGSAVDERWRQTPDVSRRLYAGAQTPGQPMEGSTGDVEGAPEQARSNFCTVDVFLQRCDA
ncbi:MAG: hypothetical protein EOO40_07610, partial [Deltaproteobacteria bacterium]